MRSLFCCPVCGASLERESGRLLCPLGHSYDLAREGYVHLLPVNRRHSEHPGDDREMVLARTRFLRGGWYAPLREALCALAVSPEQAAPVLLDAGCGEGYYTEALAEAAAARGGRTAGIDLSKAAVKKAARSCPSAEIAVASSYHLPLADASVDCLVNCFSPLAAEEFRRVLRQGGRFLYVVPGPRHLWELKCLLYDAPYENEERVEVYPGFSLETVTPVEARFTLPTAEDVQALFHMTPYTWKTPRESAARLSAASQLTVTAQFRIHVFRRL
ncbi:MAG: methyltransferase domain-containing protein [Deltaproteobacteria bacterium]|nr:methyltransferase domain-containing protein [Deltaproteobacteria bacterium]